MPSISSIFIYFSSFFFFNCREGAAGFLNGTTSQPRYHIKLHSRHKLRTLTLVIQAINLLLKEAVPLASNVGKKGTGLGTAPNHHLTHLLKQQGATISLCLVQVHASSVVRLDIGQEIALFKIQVVLLPEIERLYALSALLLSTNDK